MDEEVEEDDDENEIDPLAYYKAMKQQVDKKKKKNADMYVICLMQSMCVCARFLIFLCNFIVFLMPFVTLICAILLTFFGLSTLIYL